MTRYFLTAIFFYLHLASIIHGQVNEHFTDGEIGENPAWYGDTAEFIVNQDGLLQLNSADPGTSQLYTENSLADSTEWLFRIALDFSPSSNNNAQVWLMADSVGTEGLYHGYYLQLGESGSDDAITLVKDSCGQHQEICRGETGMISSSFDLEIRITRSREGEWAIYDREYGQTLFEFQASCMDLTIDRSSYFGIRCNYTSSNTQAFQFDDIIIREIYVDLLPPSLDTIINTNRNTIMLQASEPLHGPEVLDPLNYLLEPEGWEPDSVYLCGETNSTVCLEFPTSFHNGWHTLFVSKWCDSDSNCATALSQEFRTYYPVRWDVVFNELMTDTDPKPFGFPAVEYLELYNRSAEDLELQGWLLEVNGIDKYLPGIRIPSGGYYLITASPAACEGIDNCCTLYGLSLTNEGGELKLKDETHSVISGLGYERDWFQDNFKADGGWALEQIDPERPWDTRGNWGGSTDQKGGTPGKVNAISASNPDLEAPLILSFFPLDSLHLLIRFNEAIEEESLLNPSNYQLETQNEEVLAARSGDPLNNSVFLSVPKPFSEDEVVEITIEDGITDLSGNHLEPISILLGMPLRPVQEDIIINEVLYDPYPDGSEFVEIYNRSGKTVDVQWLRLCSVDPETGQLKSICRISDDTLLLCPGQYSVLSAEPEKIPAAYPQTEKSALVQDILDFPTLSNNAGSVALYDYEGRVLDELEYSEDMHSAYLSTTKGVSLERISTETPAGLSSNWSSASWESGYATPGKKNSQSFEESRSTTMFFVNPKTISPNGDGLDDVCRISVVPDEPGSLLNIRVFNESGKQERFLLTEKTLSDHNEFFWNGEDDEGLRVAYGRYILVAHLFRADKSVEIFKEVIWVSP